MINRHDQQTAEHKAFYRPPQFTRLLGWSCQGFPRRSVRTSYALMRIKRGLRMKFLGRVLGLRESLMTGGEQSNQAQREQQISEAVFLNDCARHIELLMRVGRSGTQVFSSWNDS